MDFMFIHAKHKELVSPCHPSFLLVKSLRVLKFGLNLPCMQFSHLGISRFFTSSALSRLLQQLGICPLLAGYPVCLDGSDPVCTHSLWVFDHG